MKMGKVIGQVIAPRKEGNLNGLKLLVVRYLDENLRPTARTAACVDAVNANFGDVVLLCSWSSARMTSLTRNVCTDLTIIGVIDSISSGRTDRYKKP